MHNWRSRAAAAVAVPVLAMTAAACGESGGDAEGLSGNVRVDGSSTVAPLSEAASELFREENPQVNVTVGTSGTGGGFEKFCNGETDISDASRPIKDEEIAACEKNGIKFEELVVANDALTVMVNPENPTECLTVEQLTSIWEPGSKLKKWEQVKSLEGGMKGDLVLYGPGTDSGTFDYFTDAINGEEGEQRTDYNDIGESDNEGITGVAGAKSGMFYAGFSYFEENKDKAKALQIDDGNGCVEPSLATVQDGSYTPLGRELFIYISDKALKKPQALEFVKFYIANHADITSAAGYIGLTDEQVTKSEDGIAKLAG